MFYSPHVGCGWGRGRGHVFPVLQKIRTVFFFVLTKRLLQLFSVCVEGYVFFRIPPNLAPPPFVFFAVGEKRGKCALLLFYFIFWNKGEKRFRWGQKSRKIAQAVFLVFFDSCPPPSPCLVFFVYYFAVVFLYFRHSFYIYEIFIFAKKAAICFRQKTCSRQRPKKVCSPEDSLNLRPFFANNLRKFVVFFVNALLNISARALIEPQHLSLSID